MMRAWGLLLVILCLAGPVAAHPKAYVNVTGDQLMVPKNCHTDDVSQGGVCFEGGHILPDETGQANVFLSDKFLQTVSGCFQQLAGPCHPFCSSATLRQGIDWIPSEDLDIFLDGAVFGSPLFSACGLTLSEAAWGRVDHT